MTVHSEDAGMISESTNAFEEESRPTEMTFVKKVSVTDVPKDETSVQKPEYKVDIVWVNVLGMIVLHAWALYGLKLAIFDASWKTNAFGALMFYLAGLGVTAANHRMWCHRAYSATFPLRVLLAILSAMAFQNSIFDWTRDHRVHHKYSETNADPYNAKRGFFFSQIGWLMCRKHPDVLEKGKGIDISDLRADPIVMFQRKYFYWLGTIFCMYLPAVVPHYLWGEDMLNAFFICFALRFTLVMHSQGTVNSVAHLWGDRPYEKSINPSENFFAVLFSCGEGFHNFHHTFPWDYAASEWGTKFNLTTPFINFCARLGLAYNLKRVPQETVDRRRRLKGDGSKVWYPEILYKRQKST